MEKMKKNILVFNSYYLPGYKAGGPIRTLANMVDRLGGDFNFKVVTGDRDGGDDQPYPEIAIDTWTEVGNADVKYLNLSEISFENLKEIVTEANPDVIYLNSFFDSRLTQKVLLLRRLGKLANIPIILAPRGEFSEGALAIKKVKKQAYIALARLTGLYKNLTWQVSSEFEKKDIQRALPNVKDEDIHIAIDLAPAIDTELLSEVKSKTPGKLKAVFLSRISRMKNLDYALSILSKVKSQVEFTIYGPKEDPRYWEECEGLIKLLPNNIQVFWKGVLTPDQVNTALAEYELFFFPTRGENYGHVIHEALSSGLPVLISDQTPWQDLEKAKVGWVLPLNAPEQFAKQIDEAAKWGSNELTVVSQAARKYAAEKASNDLALDANRNLFLNAIKETIK